VVQGFRTRSEQHPKTLAGIQLPSSHSYPGAFKAGAAVLRV
jgi:hypothetical protein